MTIFTPSDTHILKAARYLSQSKLVAFPTETVYGLGANACDDIAVAKIYEVKQRPTFNPLISHFESTEQATKMLKLEGLALRLAQIFWPGSLTLIIDRPENCPISLLASAGHPSLAIRVPAHEVAQKLLNLCDFPVVAPSANPSGKISPSSASHVDAGLGNKIEMILDGGWCATGIESTVVDCRNKNVAVILRPGPISAEDIENVSGIPVQFAATPKGAIASPGQLESHYAPHAQVVLDVVEPAKNAAYLGFNAAASPLEHHFSLSETGDLVEAAANLFKMLHQADASGAETICVAPIPNQGIGIAINDRLKRAAAPRP